MKKLLIVLLLVSFTAFSQPFSPNASYEVCFVPGQDCASVAAKAINSAKTTVDIQAYHLTNHKIIASILQAKSRGVQVRVLLDKAGTNEGFPLLDAGIPVKIDYKKAIAHNKVAIIDNQSVITGSFNFSEGAQKRNVENLIWIKDPKLAQAYAENFRNRVGVAKVLVAR